MRELLIVRHAIALDRLESMERGIVDAHRPLSDEGIEKMELAVKGMALLQTNCHHIFTSPLLRAQQTANIVHHQYPTASLSLLETLAPPYSSKELADSLNRCQEESIVIVGHEPGLSMLIATLLCGNNRAAIELKKGGMALLRFNEKIAPGGGSLRWLMTPKQLRLLGKS